MVKGIQSTRELDFTPRGEAFPAPNDWRDVFIYFLLVDRFEWIGLIITRNISPPTIPLQLPRAGTPNMARYSRKMTQSGPRHAVKVPLDGHEMAIFKCES